jgi:hypothetical protein
VLFWILPLVIKSETKFRSIREGFFGGGKCEKREKGSIMSTMRVLRDEDSYKLTGNS